MTDIFNLPNWKVLSTEENADSFFITAEVEGEPRACIHCGVFHPKLQHFGKREQEVPDLPIRFKPSSGFFHRTVKINPDTPPVGS